MTDPPKPRFDVAAFDQVSKLALDTIVPHWASVFRAFCAEEGVTREEAMTLTTAMIHAPLPRPQSGGQSGGQS
ncbi:MAG: hypothetical protein GY856_36980 [bacterium]|nr:hypothetical protein [bacterium]